MAKPVPEVQSPLLSPQVQMLEIPLSFPVRQRAAASNDRARCALPSLPYLTSCRSQRMGPEQPAFSQPTAPCPHAANGVYHRRGDPRVRQKPTRLYFGLRETEDERLQNKKGNRRPNVALGALQTSLPSGAQREQVPVRTLHRTGAPQSRPTSGESSRARTAGPAPAHCAGSNQDK